MSYCNELRDLETKNNRIDAEILDKIAEWVKIAEKLKAANKTEDFQQLQVATPEQAIQLIMDNDIEAESFIKIFKEMTKLRSSLQEKKP